MLRIKNVLLSLLSFILINSTLVAQEQDVDVVKDTIYLIDLVQDIDRSAMRKINLGIKEAEKIGADFIVLNLNTYGGAVDAADSIRTAIIQSETPFVAFINPQAASAGALISIACDSIYMRSGSSIGAATVVNQQGEVMPDKYQSFMRGMMRSTAESHGKKVVIIDGQEVEVWHRDPKIAELMVSADSVLSFTQQEAIDNRYCEGSAESIEQVAQLLTSNDYIIVEQELTAIQKMVLFLMSPLLQGIFLMMIIGGIYFEIQSPGVGLPGAIALLGALLYFAPLYIEGLAMYWEIAVFVIAIGLILFEIFVTPGFGVAGIIGLLLLISSLVFAMIDNDMFYNYGTFNFSLLIRPIGTVFIAIFVALLGSIWLAGKIYDKKSFSLIALKTELDESDGYVGVEVPSDSLIGQECIAATDMFPSGKVEIGGRRYEATLEFGSARKGEKLRIIREEGGRVYCEK